MHNPYLRAAYPQPGSGGGFIPPPGGVFGASRAPQTYQPPPGTYFGYGQSGVFTQAPGSQFGMQHQQPHLMPAPVCPTHAGAPNMGVPQERMQEIANMLRHPYGQWPNMPSLSPQGLQQAAGCVVCHAQTHADDLSILYGVDSGAAPLIPAAGAADVIVTPQKRHIPERLIMSEAMSAAFLIDGIFAGVEPVLATTGPMSAAMFVQDSTLGNFKSVVMDVGMDFTVSVTNISGGLARFTTGVKGKPVPPGL